MIPMIIAMGIALVGAILRPRRVVLWGIAAGCVGIGVGYAVVVGLEIAWIAVALSALFAVWVRVEAMRMRRAGTASPMPPIQKPQEGRKHS